MFPALPPRVLTTLPDPRARIGYVVVITIATTVVFYEIYLQGAVSPSIIADFEIPLSTFVLASIVGNAVGALAAWAAGLADRWGRSNLILVGLTIATLVVGLALPEATGPSTYIPLYGLLSLTGGAVLVATSALVRDFSPRMGRGTAMGVWALGPSLGSLLVTSITSHTLDAHPDWQWHYRVAGIIGAVALVIAFIGLRELSPVLRDQVMTSMHERAIIEARARSRTGEVPTSALTMWRWALVIPALGISFFLMFYATRVGFLVLYLVSNFGFTPAEANDLARYWWIASACALVLSGVISDRLKVRKPIMVGAAIVSIIGLGIFAQLAERPETSYREFLILMIVMAAAGSTVSTTWLTMFSEYVERIDPTANARGMAVYGAVLRGFVVLTLLGFMGLVSAPAVLVDKGQHVAALSQTYAAELQTMGTIPPETMTALRTDPTDAKARKVAAAALTKAKIARPNAAIDAALAVPPADLMYLGEHGPEVQQAVADGPQQWKHWWWICLIGQFVMIPLSIAMPGWWSVRKAKIAAARHEERVARALQRLQAHPTPPDQS